MSKPKKIADQADLGAPLESKEAIRLLDEEGPASLRFPFSEFMRATKLSWPEMLAELRAGRLIASGTKQDGKELMFISGHEFVAWMARTGFKFPPTTH